MRRLLGMSLIALAACGPTMGSDDAGLEDSGGRDAGASDASAPDSGPSDAGPPDAGASDAGTSDAGSPDASAPDAGVQDSGIRDGGISDAGTSDSGVDGGPADAGRATHRVDVFLLPDLSTCLVGNRCDGGTCVQMYGPNGAVAARFADDSAFVVAPLGDPRLLGRPQQECVRLTLSAAELDERKTELLRYQSDVAAWTDGGIRLDLNLHVLGPVSLPLSRWGLGLWMGPWDISALARPLLDKSTDFVIVTHGIKDHSRGLHFDVGGCGGTFGGDWGISGTGYSWVPKTQGAFFFECSDHGVYTHEWLHQVEWAVVNIDGWVDRYGTNFPACGLGHPDTYSWFPSTHSCGTDPDAPSCGMSDCGGNDRVNEHVLRAHWPGNRRLRSNYCRDGRLNFDETAVDTGGRCL